ncbi:hypothetical protein [Microterricola viridarii]|uniref:DUF4232 domain-containing protein n=1 Tax=Microterricola viridarii TaxID=412690 RepID=A0A1H1PGQ4_9MICO|nr:hypothetical protein [Microterricola viridarii]SDS09829.1 hypothetical protein SAMN04489834_0858 [Microterricola viridarii]
MSTIKHPVGPQPNKVYWRRRLVVLLGLLAVIVIVVLIIVGPGRSAEAEKPTADPGTSSTPDAGSTPAAAVAGGACAPGSVSVEAVTDASDYSGEQEPALSLVVTNTGATACSLNVGTAAQVFTVKSGEDVYWTSTDCQTESSDIPFELQPGVPVKSSAPIVWDRTRSAPDTCDSDEREAAAAGGASYHLVVSLDGNTSTTSKQFILN